PEERGRAGEEQALEHLLDPVQVGYAASAVLVPVPERERRVPAELVAERAVEEGGDRVPLRRLEVQREECDYGRDDEREQEPEARPEGARVGIARPEGQDEERRELRPRRERRKGAGRGRLRREVAAADEQGRLGCV